MKKWKTKEMTKYKTEKNLKMKIWKMKEKMMKNYRMQHDKRDKITSKIWSFNS